MGFPSLPGRGGGGNNPINRLKREIEKLKKRIETLQKEVKSEKNAKKAIEKRLKKETDKLKQQLKDMQQRRDAAAKKAKEQQAKANQALDDLKNHRKQSAKKITDSAKRLEQQYDKIDSSVFQPSFLKAYADRLKCDPLPPGLMGRLAIPPGFKDANFATHSAFFKKVFTKLWDFGLDAYYLDKPKIIKLDKSTDGGEPVYYVNGMLTTEVSARGAGNKLSEKLNRPVWLIYNPSHENPPKFSTGSEGISNDYYEALYDRTWWAVFYAKLATGSLEKQRNSTTRQLTHLFYHESDKKISIVTHSQGCMQTRIALMVAGLLGKQREIRKNVRWITCGSPTKRKKEEVCATQAPGVNAYKRLRHGEDIIEAIIGFGGTNQGKWPNQSDHDMKDNYVPLVKENESVLWPK